MDKQLFNAANNGDTILTVNDRLSRSLLQQYEARQCEQAQCGDGVKAWLRPQIFSLTTWLSQQLQTLAQPPVFLSNNQCLRLWERVIESDVKATGNALLQTPQTARTACQAQRLLVQYATDFKAEYGAEDHRAFLRWRNDWVAQTVASDWHDSAERPWLLAAAFEKGLLAAPQRIVIAGFDDLTPDIERLCQVMRQQGSQLDEWQPQPYLDATTRRVAALDMTDEVRRCAHWVRQIQATQPQANIAIVVPQLNAYRDLIERTLFSELDPAAYLAGEETAQAFNLSLGQSLEREGVIAAALSLLRLGESPALEEVSRLLRSPYLGHAFSEMSQRACVDRELRRTGRALWPLPRLVKSLEYLERRQGIDAAPLAKVFATIVESRKDGKRQLPGVWAEHFSRLLRQLGWPGQRGLSSRQYQAVQHFESALGELASLDAVSAPLTRSDATTIFCRIVSAIEFQPESAGANVHVLGELEAGGLCFDHLWLLGLHDLTWPPPPSPNPFIPLPLQRNLGMKRADAERERSFTERMASRLLQAAPQVTVSWPLQIDGAEMRASAFVAHIPLEDDLPVASPTLTESPSPPDSQTPALLIWRDRPELEPLEDSRCKPLVSKKSFSGGTGILKDQALCPFRAFAHHRLRAESLDQPEIGIDNMSHGTLAHTVLEIFWHEVKTQAALLALSDAALNDALERAAEQALSRFEMEKRSDLPPRQRRIEALRLMRMAGQWLEIEKQRAPFQIKASEVGHKVGVGRLTIRTRIDRVDLLENGQEAIIDYKTGQPDAAQWLDERVTEPQLPIYCLERNSDEIGAVLFAMLRSKESECGFRGLVRD
ncbi:MAG: PD-(D/E)XK nuclease family protein, partial [Desulfuromonadales bacterium]|nr:PD-(D/E)XK nuclease family protein [Desulfuromonadales bacterium]